MRVLLVDDDISIIEMARLNLEMDGVKVSVARNGREGIELARSTNPDVILLDWMMPVMNGLEALKLLKADPGLREIPVFMLTARTQVTDVDKAFGFGADNYISKPFDPTLLAFTIEMKMKKLRGAG